MRLSEIAGEKQFGNDPRFVGLISWLLLFWGSIICCGTFGIILLFKRRTWGEFAEPTAPRNLLLMFIQGLLHFATLFTYSVGAY